MLKSRGWNQDRQAVILGLTGTTCTALIKAACTPLTPTSMHLWGQRLLWSPLRVPENPIMHVLCQLTQLYNRNHAAHWILGGYCRKEQVCPEAGEEMVYMWVYFSPPSAAPAPVQTLVSFWGPWRHGLLFAVKTVWSLCLFVFYRLIKTQVLHACPHREAPGPHLKALFPAGVSQRCISATFYISNHEWTLPKEKDWGWPETNIC